MLLIIWKDYFSRFHYRENKYAWLFNIGYIGAESEVRSKRLFVDQRANR